jgi:hypothetical protein
MITGHRISRIATLGAPTGVLAAVFLACVTAAAVQAQQQPKGRTQARSPKAWRRDSVLSRMGDPPLYLIRTVGKGEVSGSTSSLTVACGGQQGKSMRVVLLPHATIDAEIGAAGIGLIPVRVRLDDAAPREESWGVLSNLQAAVAPSDDWQYARELEGASRLLIEVPLYNIGRQTVEFTLDGYSGALAWLERVCGVTLPLRSP